MLGFIKCSKQESKVKFIGHSVSAIMYKIRGHFVRIYFAELNDDQPSKKLIWFAFRLQRDGVPSAHHWIKLAFF